MLAEHLSLTFIVNAQDHIEHNTPFFEKIRCSTSSQWRHNRLMSSYSNKNKLTSACCNKSIINKGFSLALALRVVLSETTWLMWPIETANQTTMEFTKMAEVFFKPTPEVLLYEAFYQPPWLFPVTQLCWYPRRRAWLYLYTGSIFAIKC